MMWSKKGFASIIILLFLLFFLFIAISSEKEEITDLIVINQVETKKENIYLNFEKTILNNLNNCEENPLIVKESIVSEINRFGKDNNFYIKDLISLEKEKLNLLNTSSITTVIIYKPVKHILVKEVYITNGITSTKQLGFTVSTRKYTSNYFFERKYFLRKVILC